MLAGMDTMSNALSRTLQILANSLEAQAKLRTEVLETRNGEPSIDYESIVKLPYLDAVCRETLRLYSPVHLVPRRCVPPVLVFSPPLPLTFLVCPDWPITDC